MWSWCLFPCLVESFLLFLYLVLLCYLIFHLWKLLVNLPYDSKNQGGLQTLGSSAKQYGNSQSIAFSWKNLVWIQLVSWKWLSVSSLHQMCNPRSSDDQTSGKIVCGHRISSVQGMAYIYKELDFLWVELEICILWKEVWICHEPSTQQEIWLGSPFSYK